MQTYRDLTVLPRALQRNATAIYVVAPKGTGKTVVLASLAEYLHNYAIPLGVSDFTWSQTLRRQRDQVLLDHHNPIETPRLEELQEPEWFSFVKDRRPVVVIGVPGEDLLRAGTVDPVRIRGLLSDGIVVFCHNPALESQHLAGSPWATKGAHRGLAYYMHDEFGFKSDESFERAGEVLWGCEGFQDLHVGWDQVKPILARADMEFKPKRSVAEERWVLTELKPDEVQRCNLVLHKIDQTVSHSVSLQNNLLGQILPGHPAVIRKIVRLNVIKPHFLVGLSVNPDEQLRRIFGNATHHLTAGGIDVASRLMGEGSKAMEIDDFAEDGPRELFTTITQLLSVVKPRTLLQRAVGWLRPRPRRPKTVTPTAPTKADVPAVSSNRVKATSHEDEIRRLEADLATTAPKQVKPTLNGSSKGVMS